ncbi:MAG: TlyA family RNA methyltransferase [Bradymonadia bacterium]
MPPKIPKARLDDLLVQVGLAPDLRKARAYIMAGQVVAGERRVDRAHEKFPVDTPVRLKGVKTHGFVGRGGLKLAGALDHFQLDPTGRVGLDLGASTGGFTDVLLQRGATRVYAVDVGHNQLHNKLRQDERVISLEKTDARNLSTALIPDPVGALVADISFNSLARIIEPAVQLLAPGAWAALLIKPQFEARADEVGDGGIVADEALHTRVCDEVSEAVRTLGLTVLGVVPAAIRGGYGNQEYMLGAVKA